MKPRSRIEKAAEQCAHLLPKPTASMHKFAETLFEMVGLIDKDGVIHCLECGETFPAPGNYDKQSKTAVCPHCGKTLEVSPIRNRKRSLRKIVAMNVMATCNGMQVIRTYYCHKIAQPDTPSSLTLYETIQHWYDPSINAHSIRALNRTQHGYYNDQFVYDSELSTKQPSYYFSYEICGEHYPHGNVLPVLRRNGFSAELMRHINPYHAVANLLMTPSVELETIIKTRRWDIIHGMDGINHIKTRWQQLKLIIRHNYVPDSYPLWTDTMKYLAKFGYDTSNPKYVCPADLMGLHDEMMRKERKWQERENKRKAREKVLRLESDNKEYIAKKGAYFGLCFTKGNITIKPLVNIAEFVEEGDAMGHCVGSESQHYWSKNCLILSAREKGKRIATIELSLDTMKIRQCFGPHNTEPAHNKEIRMLISRNIPLIRKLSNKQ